MKFEFVGSEGVSDTTARVCRLVTGELVMTQVAVLSPGEYKFTDPIIFEVVQGPQGGTGIRAGSFIPLGLPGDTCTIKEQQIQFWIDNPNQVLLDKYVEVTSKIIAARNMPKGPILN